MRKSLVLIAFSVLLGNTNAQTPDWATAVAPILYNNCTNCHIEGGIAPWSLVGYNNAANHGNGIKSKTASRKMPPWPADPTYKRYAHERLLSADEIQTISDWVDGGMPMGDTSKAPAKPVLKKGGSIVNPDLNLKMPDYLVKTYTDEYRCFVLPTGMNTDKFLTEIEVVPGNLTVVHHVLVFYDTSSIPLQKDILDPKPGYLGFGGTGSESSKLIGVWVPGQEPFKMPPGMGIRLEKSGYIILQIHYPANVDYITDSSRVKIKCTSTALREVGIAPALNHGNGSLQNGPLYIPPDQKKSFTEKYDLGADVSVFAVAPHMHLIGQSIQAFAVRAPGDTIPLIRIPAWDFHWQRTYTFEKVMKVKKGTVLWGNASYDNTSGNSQNPNSPPKAVSLGEATTDEMMLVYFWYVAYQNGDENIVIDTSSQKSLVASVPRLIRDGWKAWPVPTGNELHISTAQAFVANGLQVIAADGRKVNCPWKTESGGVVVNTESLAPGMYQACLNTGKGLIVLKFLCSKP